MNSSVIFICWQAEEAREHCKACQIDVGEKRVDLVNTKSEIITQLREMVSQCDLTLKAVSSFFLCCKFLFKAQTKLNQVLHLGQPYAEAPEYS